MPYACRTHAPVQFTTGLSVRYAKLNARAVVEGGGEDIFRGDVQHYASVVTGVGKKGLEKRPCNAIRNL